jgi:hypothetical protein
MNGWGNSNDMKVAKDEIVGGKMMEFVIVNEVVGGRGKLIDNGVCGTINCKLAKVNETQMNSELGSVFDVVMWKKRESLQNPFLQGSYWLGRSDIVRRRGRFGGGIRCSQGAVDAS